MKLWQYGTRGVAVTDIAKDVNIAIYIRVMQPKKGLTQTIL